MIVRLNAIINVHYVCLNIFNCRETCKCIVLNQYESHSFLLRDARYLSVDLKGAGIPPFIFRNQHAIK